MLSVMPKQEMEDDVVTSCSAPFSRIGNLTGCYHVGADEVTWDAAEDACQNLDPRAHLVSFETDEVIYNELKVTYKC